MESRVRRPLSSGVTNLMLACQQGRDTEVKSILSQKPFISSNKDRYGRNAVHYCAENSSLSCAYQLLSLDRRLVNVQDNDGYSPLHLAVISGNKVMARFLLRMGADVNALDNEKHSCVHWATVSADVESLEILLESEAKLSTPDIHSAYPLHYAAQMCGPNSKDGPDVLRLLLQHGASVDCRDRDGRQPLLWAACSGSSDGILSIVAAGGTISAKDNDGLSALHYAASRGHTECLDVLINLCGASVDETDNSGCTALYYSVALGHADCTQLLLKYGADADHRDLRGRTPAHCAAAKGHLEMMKILDSHGANLWIRNIKGDLPLHEAVQSGRKDLVCWLLDQNSHSVNAPNVHGKTPLHVGASNNNVELCQVLLDRGACVNALMKTSKSVLMTPMDAALSRRFRRCAKYLQSQGALPANKLLEKCELSRSLVNLLESAARPSSSEGLNTPVANTEEGESLPSPTNESIGRRQHRDSGILVNLSQVDFWELWESLTQNSQHVLSTPKSENCSEGSHISSRQPIVNKIYVYKEDEKIRNAQEADECQRNLVTDDDVDEQDHQPNNLSNQVAKKKSGKESFDKMSNASPHAERIDNDNDSYSEETEQINKKHKKRGKMLKINESSRQTIETHFIKQNVTTTKERGKFLPKPKISENDITKKTTDVLQIKERNPKKDIAASEGINNDIVSNSFNRKVKDDKSVIYQEKEFSKPVKQSSFHGGSRKRPVKLSPHKKQHDNEEKSVKEIIKLNNEDKSSDTLATDDTIGRISELDNYGADMTQKMTAEELPEQNLQRIRENSGSSSPSDDLGVEETPHHLGRKFVNREQNVSNVNVASTERVHSELRTDQQANIQKPSIKKATVKWLEKKPPEQKARLYERSSAQLKVHHPSLDNINDNLPMEKRNENAADAKILECQTQNRHKNEDRSHHAHTETNSSSVSSIDESESLPTIKQNLHYGKSTEKCLSHDSSVSVLSGRSMDDGTSSMDINLPDIHAHKNRDKQIATNGVVPTNLATDIAWKSDSSRYEKLSTVKNAQKYIDREKNSNFYPSSSESLSIVFSVSSDIEETKPLNVRHGYQNAQQIINSKNSQATSSSELSSEYTGSDYSQNIDGRKSKIKYENEKLKSRKPFHTSGDEHISRRNKDLQKEMVSSQDTESLSSTSDSNTYHTLSLSRKHRNSIIRMWKRAAAAALRFYKHKLENNNNTKSNHLSQKSKGIGLHYHIDKTDERSYRSKHIGHHSIQNKIANEFGYKNKKKVISDRRKESTKRHKARFLAQNKATKYTDTPTAENVTANSEHIVLNYPSDKTHKNKKYNHSRKKKTDDNSLGAIPSISTSVENFNTVDQLSDDRKLSDLESAQPVLRHTPIVSSDTQNYLKMVPTDVCKQNRFIDHTTAHISKLDESAVRSIERNEEGRQTYRAEQTDMIAEQDEESQRKIQSKYKLERNTRYNKTELTSLDRDKNNRSPTPRLRDIPVALLVNYQRDSEQDIDITKQSNEEGRKSQNQKKYSRKNKACRQREVKSSVCVASQKDLILTNAKRSNSVLSMDDSSSSSEMIKLTIDDATVLNDKITRVTDYSCSNYNDAEIKLQHYEDDRENTLQNVLKQKKENYQFAKGEDIDIIGNRITEVVKYDQETSRHHRKPNKKELSQSRSYHDIKVEGDKVCRENKNNNQSFKQANSIEYDKMELYEDTNYSSKTIHVPSQIMKQNTNAELIKELNRMDKGLNKKIEITADGLRDDIKHSTTELKEEIECVSKELKDEIKDMKFSLTDEIIDNNKKYKNEVKSSCDEIKDMICNLKGNDETINMGQNRITVTDVEEKTSDVKDELSNKIHNNYETNIEITNPQDIVRKNENLEIQMVNNHNKDLSYNVLKEIKQERKIDDMPIEKEANKDDLVFRDTRYSENGKNEKIEIKRDNDYINKTNDQSLHSKDDDIRELSQRGYDYSKKETLNNELDFRYDETIHKEFSEQNYVENQICINQNNDGSNKNKTDVRRKHSKEMLLDADRNKTQTEDTNYIYQPYEHDKNKDAVQTDNNVKCDKGNVNENIHTQSPFDITLTTANERPTSTVIQHGKTAVEDRTQNDIVDESSKHKSPAIKPSVLIIGSSENVSPEIEDTSCNVMKQILPNTLDLESRTSDEISKTDQNQRALEKALLVHNAFKDEVNKDEIITTENNYNESNGKLSRNEDAVSSRKWDQLKTEETYDETEHKVISARSIRMLRNKSGVDGCEIERIQQEILKTNVSMTNEDDLVEDNDSSKNNLTYNPLIGNENMLLEVKIPLPDTSDTKPFNEKEIIELNTSTVNVIPHESSYGEFQDDVVKQIHNSIDSYETSQHIICKKKMEGTEKVFLIEAREEKTFEFKTGSNEDCEDYISKSPSSKETNAIRNFEDSEKISGTSIKYLNNEELPSEQGECDKYDKPMGDSSISNKSNQNFQQRMNSSDIDQSRQDTNVTQLDSGTCREENKDDNDLMAQKKAEKEITNNVNENCSFNEYNVSKGKSLVNETNRLCSDQDDNNIISHELKSRSFVSLEEKVKETAKDVSYENGESFKSNLSKFMEFSKHYEEKSDNEHGLVEVTSTKAIHNSPEAIDKDPKSKIDCVEEKQMEEGSSFGIKPSFEPISCRKTAENKSKCDNYDDDVDYKESHKQRLCHSAVPDKKKFNSIEEEMGNALDRKSAPAGRMDNRVNNDEWKKEYITNDNMKSFENVKIVKSDTLTPSNASDEETAEDNELIEDQYMWMLNAITSENPKLSMQDLKFGESESVDTCFSQDFKMVSDTFHSEENAVLRNQMEISDTETLNEESGIESGLKENGKVSVREEDIDSERSINDFPPEIKHVTVTRENTQESKDNHRKESDDDYVEEGRPASLQRKNGKVSDTKQSSDPSSDFSSKIVVRYNNYSNLQKETNEINGKGMKDSEEDKNYVSNRIRLNSIKIQNSEHSSYISKEFQADRHKFLNVPKDSDQDTLNINSKEGLKNKTKPTEKQTEEKYKNKHDDNSEYLPCESYPMTNLKVSVENNHEETSKRSINDVKNNETDSSQELNKYTKIKFENGDAQVVNKTLAEYARDVFTEAIVDNTKDESSSVSVEAEKSNIKYISSSDNTLPANDITLDENKTVGDIEKNAPICDKEGLISNEIAVIKFENPRSTFDTINADSSSCSSNKNILAQDVLQIVEMSEKYIESKHPGDDEVKIEKSTLVQEEAIAQPQNKMSAIDDIFSGIINGDDEKVISTGDEMKKSEEGNERSEHDRAIEDSSAMSQESGEKEHDREKSLRNFPQNIEYAIPIVQSKLVQNYGNSAVSEFDNGKDLKTENILEMQNITASEINDNVTKDDDKHLLQERSNDDKLVEGQGVGYNYEKLQMDSRLPNCSDEQLDMREGNDKGDTTSVLSDEGRKSISPLSEVKHHIELSDGKIMTVPNTVSSEESGSSFISAETKINISEKEYGHEEISDQEYSDDFSYTQSQTDRENCDEIQSMYSATSFRTVDIAEEVIEESDKNDGYSILCIDNADENLISKHKTDEESLSESLSGANTKSKLLVETANTKKITDEVVLIQMRLESTSEEGNKESIEVQEITSLPIEGREFHGKENVDNEEGLNETLPLHKLAIQAENKYHKYVNTPSEINIQNKNVNQESDNADEVPNNNWSTEKNNKDDIYEHEVWADPYTSPDIEGKTGEQIQYKNESNEVISTLETPEKSTSKSDSDVIVDNASMVDKMGKNIQMLTEIENKPLDSTELLGITEMQEMAESEIKDQCIEEMQHDRLKENDGELVESSSEILKTSECLKTEDIENKNSVVSEQEIEEGKSIDRMKDTKCTVESTDTTSNIELKEPPNTSSNYAEIESENTKKDDRMGSDETGNLLNYKNIIRSTDAKSFSTELGSEIDMKNDLEGRQPTKSGSDTSLSKHINVSVTSNRTDENKSGEMLEKAPLPIILITADDDSSLETSCEMTSEKQNESDVEDETYKDIEQQFIDKYRIQVPRDYLTPSPQLVEEQKETLESGNDFENISCRNATDEIMEDTKGGQHSELTNDLSNHNSLKDSQQALHHPYRMGTKDQTTQAPEQEKIMDDRTLPQQQLNVKAEPKAEGIFTSIQNLDEVNRCNWDSVDPLFSPILSSTLEKENVQTSNVKQESASARKLPSIKMISSSTQTIQDDYLKGKDIKSNVMNVSESYDSNQQLLIDGATRLPTEELNTHVEQQKTQSENSDVINWKRSSAYLRRNQLPMGVTCDSGAPTSNSTVTPADEQRAQRSDETTKEGQNIENAVSLSEIESSDRKYDGVANDLDRDTSKQVRDDVHHAAMVNIGSEDHPKETNVAPETEMVEALPQNELQGDANADKVNELSSKDEKQYNGITGESGITPQSNKKVEISSVKFQDEHSSIKPGQNILAENNKRPSRRSRERKSQGRSTDANALPAFSSNKLNRRKVNIKRDILSGQRNLVSTPKKSVEKAVDKFLSSRNTEPEKIGNLHDFSYQSNESSFVQGEKKTRTESIHPSVFNNRNVLESSAMNTGDKNTHRASGTSCSRCGAAMGQVDTPQKLEKSVQRKEKVGSLKQVDGTLRSISRAKGHEQKLNGRKNVAVQVCPISSKLRANVHSKTTNYSSMQYHPVDISTTQVNQYEARCICQGKGQRNLCCLQKELLKSRARLSAARLPRGLSTIPEMSGDEEMRRIRRSSSILPSLPVPEPNPRLSRHDRKVNSIIDQIRALTSPISFLVTVEGASSSKSRPLSVSITPADRFKSKSMSDVTEKRRRTASSSIINSAMRKGVSLPDFTKKVAFVPEKSESARLGGRSHKTSERKSIHHYQKTQQPKLLPKRSTISRPDETRHASVENEDQVAFHIEHGKERDVFLLPTETLEDKQKWELTFTIKKEGH